MCIRDSICFANFSTIGVFEAEAEVVFLGGCSSELGCLATSDAGVEAGMPSELGLLCLFLAIVDSGDQQNTVRELLQRISI